MINEIVRQLTAVVRERNMTKCVARYVIYSFRRASAYYSLPPHQDRKLLVRMHTHTNIVTLYTYKYNEGICIRSRYMDKDTNELYKIIYATNHQHRAYRRGGFKCRLLK